MRKTSKKLKKWEKTLTNEKSSGIIEILLRKDDINCGRRHIEKRWKKLLTKAIECDILNELLMRDHQYGFEKFEKRRKKFLTSWFESDKIIKLSRRAAANKIVPCKLNNASLNELQTWNSFEFILRSNRKQQLRYIKSCKPDNLETWLERALLVVIQFFREFDPGSGWTLAACLTHASRTELTDFGL